MKFFKKISYFFDRIRFEIRRIKLKTSLIIAGIYALIGVLTWIFGGSIHRVLTIYQAPRSAMPIALMYVFWFISFALSGFILANIMFGCEKFRRQQVYKLFVCLIVMQLFTFLSYPLFFGALSSFLAFLSFLVATVFCFFSIVFSFRIYSLWSICLCVHLIWLLYNCLIALSFSLLN